MGFYYKKSNEVTSKADQISLESRIQLLGLINYLELESVASLCEASMESMTSFTCLSSGAFPPCTGHSSSVAST